MIYDIIKLAPGYTEVHLLDERKAGDEDDSIRNPCGYVRRSDSACSPDRQDQPQIKQTAV